MRSSGHLPVEHFPEPLAPMPVLLSSETTAIKIINKRLHAVLPSPTATSPLIASTSQVSVPYPCSDFTSSLRYLYAAFPFFQPSFAGAVPLMSPSLSTSSDPYVPLALL